MHQPYSVYLNVVNLHFAEIFNIIFSLFSFVYLIVIKASVWELTAACHSVYVLVLKFGETAKKGKRILNDHA